VLKIIGALMILVSATAIGASYSTDLKKHCMELRLLKQMLYMLRGELKYTRTPLPEAFLHIAERLPAPFSVFLQETSREMAKYDGRTFSALWQEAVKKQLYEVHLKKEEKEQLLALGEILGYLDLEMQLSSIELYLEQLEVSIRNAQDTLGTRQKLCQSLGIAGGVFLIILLI